MRNQEKIEYAIQRKKELDLLIKHWSEQDETKAKTNQNTEKTIG